MKFEELDGVEIRDEKGKCVVTNVLITFQKD